MNCRTVQNNLSAYLDRELSGEEMLAMRAHVCECRACQEEEQAMRALKALLSGLPTPPAASDLEERLIATVHRAERQVHHQRLWTGSAVVFAVMSASAMFGILSLIGSGSPSQREARSRDRAEAMISAEIRRDQAHVAVADPYGGNLEVTEATYGR